MVHYDLHSGKTSSHFFQQGHLMRQDVEVEHCAQALRLTPKRIERFRVQPCGLRMVERTETHPLKSMLFDPVTQTLGSLGILWIEQTVRHEQARIPMERVTDVRVVPTVVAWIDQDGVTQAVIAHFLNFILDGSRHLGARLRMLGMMKRELRVQSPYLQVGVDDQGLGFCPQNGRLYQEPP